MSTISTLIPVAAQDTSIAGTSIACTSTAVTAAPGMPLIAASLATCPQGAGVVGLADGSASGSFRGLSVRGGYLSVSRLRPVAPIFGATAGTDFGAAQLDPGSRTWSPPV